MSMPLPIHIVLIGSSSERIRSARRHLRLSTPGIGAPYLCALDAEAGNGILPPAELSKALITLWLALDSQSLQVAQKLHSGDLRTPRYGRGFYADLLPEACMLVEGDTPSQQHVALKDWERRITDAWYKTS